MELAASAVNALAGMKRFHRKVVLALIRTHLVDNDPSEVTRNKFPLKRPSDQAERELRLDIWRVFYTVTDDGSLVIVNLVGEKRKNKLFIGGEEFEL